MRYVENAWSSFHVLLYSGPASGRSRVAHGSAVNGPKDGKSLPAILSHGVPMLTCMEALMPRAHRYRDVAY